MKNQKQKEIFGKIRVLTDIPQSNIQQNLLRCASMSMYLILIFFSRVRIQPAIGWSKLLNKYPHIISLDIWRNSSYQIRNLRLPLQVMEVSFIESSYVSFSLLYLLVSELDLNPLSQVSSYLLCIFWVF